MQKILKLLKVRDRYVFTRHDTLRLRYVASGACLAMAFMISVASLSNRAEALQAVNIASVPKSIQDPDLYTFPAQETQARLSEVLNSRLYGKFSLASVTAHDIPRPKNEVIEIEPGDALGLVLQKQGVPGAEVGNVINALSEHFDPRNIRAGQEVALNFVPKDEAPVEPGAAAEYDLTRLSIEIDPIRAVVVEKEGENFVSTLREKSVDKVTRVSQAKIDVSVFGAAAKASIPKTVVGNMINIYSHNVDFQRDIRSGDQFEIMYDSFETEDGYVAKTGEIQFARLIVGGKERAIYRYEMKDGRVDYFDKSGRSIRKTLMKTPIDGARMSSGFGMRRHPVLGYNKMHKGVDFAAPTGTPIYAAGDGVVERAGRFSSYGNYVLIRHNSQLKTAYAHMHRIDSKVRPGQRVRQGQVIGSVGTTGRSTGPHLHYEVLKNGVQVNPRSVDLPIGEELTGSEMAAFKDHVRRIDSAYKLAKNDMKYAQFSSTANPTN